MKNKSLWIIIGVVIVLVIAAGNFCRIKRRKYAGKAGKPG